MPFNTVTYQVMIASPGDVAKEREIVRQLVHEWNIIHSSRTKIVLLPISWDTHTTPEMGKRPQEIINEQVLDKCDLLVGVFWTRIGTPTGVSVSGTVEEIERQINAGKPVMLYFSSAPVQPDSIDQDQYLKLKEFKEKIKQKGLYESYDSLSEFKEMFRRHLSLKVFNDNYFNLDFERNEKVSIDEPKFDLSKEAKELLIETSKSNDGTILKLRTFDGLTIQTNQRQFIESKNPRLEALWQDVIDSLLDQRFIQDMGYKGEVFSLTSLGYEVADVLITQ